jgi:hypothetical protein
LINEFRDNHVIVNGIGTYFSFGDFFAGHFFLTFFLIIKRSNFDAVISSVWCHTLTFPVSFYLHRRYRAGPGRYGIEHREDLSLCRRESQQLNVPGDYALRRVYMP